MRNQKKRRTVGRLGSSQRADAALWAGIARLNDLNRADETPEIDDGLSWMMDTRYQRRSGRLSERIMAAQEAEAA